MSEISLEELVEEREFLDILQPHVEVFLRLANTLLDRVGEEWTRSHYFQLLSATDSLESVLDEFGARYNRTYGHLTELVASLRWFAHTGFSITHLLRRLDSYVVKFPTPAEHAEARVAIDGIGAFVRSSAGRLLGAIRSEANHVGLVVPTETQPESDFAPVVVRRRLSRNVGQAVLVDEKQKIAEVASKFLQVCESLSKLDIRRIEDPHERARYLAANCTEEQARVYEAQVHNLQSIYDTHIANTVLEAQDSRLPVLRGHVSVALHLLEAVTFLTHFVERHEDEERRVSGKERISALVVRAEVQKVILHELLRWTYRTVHAGAGTARGLLPSYMNVMTLEVRLAEGIALHARPVALIVGIVNRYGTPVEMEVNGTVANAGSILKMLMAVGSNPDERRFVFRGNERTLRDIQLLFESDLGEHGLAGLPDELDYLREH
ncbi:MAG: HPr family phosphocarrier protein [Planctomycetota bacterium]